MPTSFLLTFNCILFILKTNSCISLYTFMDIFLWVTSSLPFVLQLLVSHFNYPTVLQFSMYSCSFKPLTALFILFHTVRPSGKGAFFPFLPMAPMFPLASVLHVITSSWTISCSLHVVRASGEGTFLPFLPGSVIFPLVFVFHVVIFLWAKSSSVVSPFTLYRHLVRVHISLSFLRH